MCEINKITLTPTRRKATRQVMFVGVEVATVISAPFGFLETADDDFCNGISSSEPDVDDCTRIRFCDTKKSTMLPVNKQICFIVLTSRHRFGIGLVATTTFIRFFITQNIQIAFGSNRRLVC